MTVTIIIVLCSVLTLISVLLLLFASKRPGFNLSTTSTPLPTDFHTRLAQLEADLVATKARLGEAESRIELNYKSLTQRIVRGGRRRSEEEEELAEMGRLALAEHMNAPAEPPRSAVRGFEEANGTAAAPVPPGPGSRVVRMR